jgi:hypothetical protein
LSARLHRARYRSAASRRLPPVSLSRQLPDSLPPPSTPFPYRISCRIGTPSGFRERLDRGRSRLKMDTAGYRIALELDPNYQPSFSLSPLRVIYIIQFICAPFIAPLSSLSPLRSLLVPIFFPTGKKILTLIPRLSASSRYSVHSYNHDWRIVT